MSDFKSLIFAKCFYEILPRIYFLVFTYTLNRTIYYINIFKLGFSNFKVENFIETKSQGNENFFAKEN